MENSGKTLIEELVSQEKATQDVRIIFAVVLILVCTTGSIINGLNFYAIIFRIQKRDGFLKICGLNSFGNTLVCFGYLCFPVPVLLINEPPNHWQNAVMGQLIGWFAWSFAPLAQILLATNRITAIGIIAALSVAVFLFLVLLPEGCHYLFNADYVGWIGEISTCTEIAQDMFLVSMMVIAAFTAICSVLLFFKLILNTTEQQQISSYAILQRHRKNRRMIIQALIQSALIILDSFNSTVTYNVFPNLLFQFLTLSFSMVFLRTVEGFVVFYINNTINTEVQKILGIKKSSQNGTIFVQKRESMSTGTRKQNY